MPTTVVSSIGSGGGRDYSTLQAWEDAAPADLVAADQIWKGECHNDSEFTQTTFANLEVIGGTTDTTRYKWLTAADTQSFQDHANVRTNQLRYNVSNGVGITKSGNYYGCIRCTEDNFHVDRIQFRLTGGVSNTVLLFASGASGKVLKDCLVMHEGGDSAITAEGGTGTYINLVVVSRSTTAHAILETFGGTFLGCMIVRPSDVADSGGSGIHTNYNTSILQSCVILGYATPVSDPSGRWHATDSKFNAASAASGLPGTNNVHSVTFSQVTPLVDADKDSLDIRAIAATALAGAGFRDLTNAPNDISGLARTATPTSGAWELAGAAGDLLLRLQNEGLFVGQGGMAA